LLLQNQPLLVLSAKIQPHCNRNNKKTELQVDVAARLSRNRSTEKNRSPQEPLLLPWLFLSLATDLNLS